MGNIVLLDELTINKIAAGEVIERPASVIKEMVENSIDAGATNITVEIKNGGISFIKVSDNGIGIAQDDLEIAFERHATSKIRSADDLDTVTSMGFRGEALASIAAIANVEMISKTKDQEIGYRVVVEGGNVLEKEEAGCRTGTTITVKNLFFNTPVRYKFLKKDYTESGYIEDVVTRIALVNPSIAIKLINTGKTIIQTNGNGDIKSVIYSIYGKDIANAVMDVSYKYEDITITGVIGKPEIARSNRSNQLFFVNKRYIKDKTLSAATEQSYKGLIPIGKFGFVVLNLEMNPAKVDVNVHPAKLEVRFQEENKVFQSIYHAIKDTLLKGELVANTETKSQKEKTISRDATNFEERLRNLRNRKELESNNGIGGLFAFRKHAVKQIEKYTDEESKIKTNRLDNIFADGNEENQGLKEENQEYNKENSKALQEEQQPETLQGIEVPKALQEAEKPETLQGIEVPKALQEAEKPETLQGIEVPKALQEAEKPETLQGIEVPKALQEAEKPETLQGIEVPKALQEVEETDKLNELNEVEQKLEDLEEKVSNIAETNDAEKININENEENNIEINENSISQEQTNLENIDNEKELETVETVAKPEETKSFEEMYEKLFGRAPLSKIKEETKEEEKSSAIDIVKENISIFETEEELKKPAYKFIGIVFNTYIIIEMNNEMYILDQHAAHERIMYEKVKKNYYSGTEKDSQMLLLPDIITLTYKEMDIAKENKAMFEQAGFTLEEFGENTIKLTGVPNICLELNTKELFLETLDEINTVARTAKQEKEEKFIATVACKAAVKANMALTAEEVESLMDSLLELPNPFTCPHGRPTAIKMTKYDIERKFARK